MAERARAIVRAGVPVMGHVGLTPQTATALGGYRAQGRTAERAHAGARRRARAAGGRLLRDRLRGDPGRGDRRDHAAHGDPGDRDRRRRQHRRPGARPPRPAGHPRRLQARSSSSATPTSRTRCCAASRRTPRRCARARSRRPSTPTGSRPRSSSGSAPAAAASHGGLSVTARSQVVHNARPSVTPTLAAHGPAVTALRSQGARVLRPLRGGGRATSCAPPSCSSGCSSTGPTTAELARDILVCEQEGDRITHDIIQRLNQTFVTPIDREDIIALASALDDIVDFIEEVADFLGLYRIEAPMEQAQRLARDPARRPRAQIAEAIPRLRDVQGHPPLHGRDQPARERGRPDRCARRSRRCSSAGSTRWS